MNKKILKAVLISVSVFGGVSVSQAATTVLNFDDVSTTNGITLALGAGVTGAKALGTYDGYIFENAKVFNGSVTPTTQNGLKAGSASITSTTNVSTGNGYYNGVASHNNNVSGNAIYNTLGGSILSFKSLNGFAFNFESAYVTAAMKDNLQMTATGWRNGVQQSSLNFTINASYAGNGSAITTPGSNAAAQNFNFANVDEVRFSAVTGIVGAGGIAHSGYSGESTQFVIDNISVSPVPEAEEWAMMLLGLPMIGWVARRKKEEILSKK